MYRQFLEQSPLLALPIVALILFLVVFVGLLIQTFRRKNAKKYEIIAQLPLHDSEAHHE